MTVSSSADNRIGGIANLPTAAATAARSGKNRIDGIATLQTAAMADSSIAKGRVGGIATFPETDPSDGCEKQMFSATYSADAESTGSGEVGAAEGSAASSMVHDKETPPHEAIPNRKLWANREALGRVGPTNGEFPPCHRRAEGGLNDPDGTPRINAAQRNNRACQGAGRIWGRLLRPPSTVRGSLNSETT